MDSVSVEVVKRFRAVVVNSPLCRIRLIALIRKGSRKKNEQHSMISR
jgi:hypothetical protein